ncbi:MAG: acyclic terpene utilization AtuA family protein, partial [Spirillospora sp.]
IGGVRGLAPPPSTKVCLNHLGGHRNEMTFVLTGLGIEAKAELVQAQMEAAFGDARPARVEWTLVGTAKADPATQGEATALLRCAVLDPDPERVGRAFSGAAVELALAGFPGFTMTSPPGKASAYGVYIPAFVPNEAVDHVAVSHDGRRIPIPSPPARGVQPTPSVERAGHSAGGETTSVDNPATVRVPLGRVVGARSGDKGGDANVGVWARTDAQWRWLEPFLTVERFTELLPEAREHIVRRYVLPNLRAVNFVVEGMLQEGVSASTRFDPQGKALGEWLRSRLVDIPEAVL